MPSSVTFPISAQGTSHFSKTSRTMFPFPRLAMISIRSCDSLNRISYGVMPGFRTYLKVWIAHAVRDAASGVFMPQNAEAKNIYERIAFEAFIKINLAANRWDPDAVAVMSDTAYDPCKQAPVCRDLG